MKMNRRNVLVGLGTVVAGGGAALGTGAFSSVEAERTVSVDTAGDGAALLSIDVETDYEGVDDGGSDVVELNFENLNDDAVTTFDAVLTVTNTGSEVVELGVSDVPAALTFYDGEKDLSEDGNEVELDPENGNSVDIDIEVDLIEGEEPTADTEITLVAS